MTLNSQADGRVVINKPESSGFEDVDSEMRDTENSSKTLKEIQTLLMEAENIATKTIQFSLLPLSLSEMLVIFHLYNLRRWFASKNPSQLMNPMVICLRDHSQKKAQATSVYRRILAHRRILKCQRH